MRLLLLASILTTSCYFQYPDHVPKLNGGLVVEGARLEVEIKSEQRYGDCSDIDYDKNRCEIIHGKLKRPYTMYVATTPYGGRDLTRAEFMELAMPDYPDRIRGIQGEKGVCTISLVPSAIAVAAAVVAIGVPLFFSTSFTDDQKTAIYIGGAATAVGAGLLSYPIGGYACVRAKGLAGDLLEKATTTEWKSTERADLEQLATLAEAFNAKHGGPAPPGAPPATDEPAEQ